MDAMGQRPWPVLQRCGVAAAPDSGTSPFIIIVFRGPRVTNRREPGCPSKLME